MMQPAVLKGSTAADSISLAVSESSGDSWIYGDESLSSVVILLLLLLIIMIFIIMQLIIIITMVMMMTMNQSHKSTPNFCTPLPG